MLLLLLNGVLNSLSCLSRGLQHFSMVANPSIFAPTKHKRLCENEKGANSCCQERLVKQYN